MDHFIVTHGQHKLLGIGVHQTEGQLMMVELAVKRIPACSFVLSFIQPMFHLKPKPRPLLIRRFSHPAKAVDSSAIMQMPGKLGTGVDSKFVRN